MRIRRIAMLPSLMTLGNAICGFGAITLMTEAITCKDVAPQGTVQVADLYHGTVMWACGCIFLAMVFDALDGRLARFARVTSDFGGQLDSVADAVSFGMAPAFLMVWVVRVGLGLEMLEPLSVVSWVCAAVFMSCALIRLARFNVENVHDEEAHLSFRGLPSPAAAGALVSVILVTMASFWRQEFPDLMRQVTFWALPLFALALGLLMVSRMRYSHLLNQFIRGRRPVRHLVLVLLCLALAVVVREATVVIGFVGYAFSGPIGAVIRRARNRAAPPQGPAGQTPTESTPKP
jgi:CDP-diacylglycerol--serine O-phosphatidyltransferase